MKGLETGIEHIDKGFRGLKEGKLTLLFYAMNICIIEKM